MSYLQGCLNPAIFNIVHYNLSHEFAEPSDLRSVAVGSCRKASDQPKPIAPLRLTAWEWCRDFPLPAQETSPRLILVSIVIMAKEGA